MGGAREHSHSGSAQVQQGMKCAFVPLGTLKRAFQPQMLRCLFFKYMIYNMSWSCMCVEILGDYDRLCES